MCRVSWYTAGTRDPGTTGPTSQIKFSWTDGDQGEVTGAQFWFSDDVRQREGNRIVYYTDGNVVIILHTHVMSGLNVRILCDYFHLTMPKQSVHC